MKVIGRRDEEVGSSRIPDCGESDLRALSLHEHDGI